METELSHRFALDDLAPDESEALVQAAAWYFNYHADDLNRLETNQSAQALERREHLESLHSALWKLDIRLRHPARHS